MSDEKTQKFAILLRGISYLPDASAVSNSPSTDYRRCLASFLKNVVEPLREVFAVDVFLATYQNELLDQAIIDYGAKKVFILPDEELKRHENGNQHVCQFVSDCLEHLKTFGYDYILQTRFDLYFYNRLDVSKFDFNKVNFAWKGEMGQCDDNFVTIPRKYLDRVLAFLRSPGMCSHSLNMIFPGESNYISKDLNPYTGRHFPDFFVVWRYIKSANFETGELSMAGPPGVILYDY